MYGIIYQTIEKYGIETLGRNAWETIKIDGNITIDFSLMEQPYNEEILYKIAKLTAQQANKPIDDVLYDFGEYTIKATRENYSIFTEARGNNLKDSLISLPNFHNRIMLIYPELTPPEFRVSNIENNCIMLHYISTRTGMLSFIKGYLAGLIEVFNEAPNVTVVNPDKKTDKENIFKICW